MGNGKAIKFGSLCLFLCPFELQGLYSNGFACAIVCFPLNLQSWLVSTIISKQQTCLHFQNSFTTLVRDPQNICHSVLLLFFSLPTSPKGHLTPASSVPPFRRHAWLLQCWLFHIHLPENALQRSPTASLRLQNLVVHR